MSGATGATKEEAALALGFPLRGVIKQVSIDPVYGLLREPVGVLEVDKGLIKAAALDQCFRHVAEAGPSGAAPVAAVALAAASVLDDLPLVERILEVCPWAAVQHLPSGLLLNGTDSLASTHVRTPYGNALALSRGRCMHALARAVGGLGRTLDLGLERRIGMNGPAFNITGFMSQIGPSFLPCALGLALEHLQYSRSWGSRESDRAFSLFMGCAARGSQRNPMESVPSAYLPAFLASGVCDIHPHSSFQIGCVHGRPDLLRHFANAVPWEGTSFGADVFDGSPIVNAARSAGRNQSEAEVIDEAICLAMDLAHRDGRGALVTRVYEPTVGSSMRIEPVESLIEHRLHRALMAFVQAGLDPRQPIGQTGRSLIDLARDYDNGEAIALMCSFSARSAVEIALQSIENVGRGLLQVSGKP